LLKAIQLDKDAYKHAESNIGYSTALISGNYSAQESIAILSADEQLSYFHRRY